MKLYEYAAAGLRVVARRTAELERRNEPFIFCYGRQSEMPAVCRKTLALPSSREMVKGRAIQQSWTEKARTLLQFVTHILERKEHAQARR
jgi:hypothetical protein